MSRWKPASHFWPSPKPRSFMSLVGALRSQVGTGSFMVFRAKSMAVNQASVVARDFLERARATVVWARIRPDSGIPTRSTAWKQAVARLRAPFPARPMSSDAKMTMRRAINLGSSPEFTMRAR